MKLVNCIIVLCAFLCCSCQVQQKTSCVPRKDLLQSVKEKGTIVFGVKKSAPPFSVEDNDGSYWGFDIEIAQAVAKEMGIKADFVSILPSERISAIEEGRVDAVIASMTITRSRDKKIDFTIPYFQDGQSLLCRKTSSDITSYRTLKGKKVGAVAGSTSLSNMGKAQPDCSIKTFNDYESALAALEKNELDAVTSDMMLLLGLRNKKGNNEKFHIVGGRFSIEPYGIGIPENQSNLRDQLNEAIMALWIKEEWQDIYTSWFGPGSLYDIDEGNFHINVFPE